MILFPGPGRAAELPAVLTGSPAAENLPVRIQRRDPAAMRDLYKLYGRSIYTLALRTVRSPAAAEEVTLEAFLRTWSLTANGLETRPPDRILLSEARRISLDYLARGGEGGGSAGNPFLYNWTRPSVEQLRALRSKIESLSATETALLDVFMIRNRCLDDGADELEQDRDWLAARLRQLLTDLAEAAGLDPDGFNVARGLISLPPSEYAPRADNFTSNPLPHQVRSLMAAILLLHREQEPSSRLGERVVSMVAPGAGRVYLICAWALVAGLSGAFIRTANNNASRIAEAKRLRADLIRASGLGFEPAALTQMRPAESGEARGSYYSAPGALLLIASRLPRLPEGRVWQMWVLDSNGESRSAGTFRADGSGSAVYLYRWDPSLGSPRRAGISDEPESGSRVPTTPLQLITPAR